MQKDIILQGDCVEILKTLPSKSIDLIFADPPYFMQTEGELLRVEGKKFSGVQDSWDKFESLVHYDRFSTSWLSECKRVLKDNGSIWVIGSFQNIFRIGYIMQDLGFWILNDIIWSKPNPVPNFRGSRFCNAHETLLWCAKNKNAKYTFNYQTMKYLNNNKQEKSVWNIGICIGNERLKNSQGKKLHATQKPLDLLEKVVLSSSKIGDIVLDPFFGTGTSGVAAKKLKRHFIGIEQNISYIKAAKQRIKAVQISSNVIKLERLESKPPRVSLKELLESQLLQENERFYNKKGEFICALCGDSKDYKVCDEKETLSIHKMAAKHANKASCNGWSYFYIMRDEGLKSIDSLRYEYQALK